jgi:hypothetical protein
MPDARCTRDLVCELCSESCTRAYRAAENIRHSLRNGFTAYNAIPGRAVLVVTVASRKRWLLWNLTPAYGASQDHASLPYAQAALVSRNLSVHRDPPNVRDDGQRPSGQDGMAKDMPLI